MSVPEVLAHADGLSMETVVTNVPVYRAFFHGMQLIIDGMAKDKEEGERGRAEELDNPGVIHLFAGSVRSSDDNDGTADAC